VKFIELSSINLQQHLSHSGIFFRIGPFGIHLQSNLTTLTSHLQLLYSNYDLLENHSFSDFHVNIYRPFGIRRIWRPQVHFKVDNDKPFAPFPEDTALPFMEWGLNWCVATRAHQYLMLHAGVVEKHDKVLLLPALPGSGKSTLTAALEHRGWRLLSDEFALVRPQDLLVVPFPRLIPLKNESIPIIRDFAESAVIGPAFHKTRKGTVAHLRPTLNSIVQSQKQARVRWIVFPHFEKGVSLSLKPITKERAFLKLSSNSFNYELLGLTGFEAASKLIDASDCYLFHYDSLEQAVAQMDRLADDSNTIL
jgi:HprK-related kinase A